MPTVKQEKRIRRKTRIRARVSGTPDRPRLSVFRSNQHLYAQLINDESGTTMTIASDLELKKSAKKKGVEVAKEVGKVLAAKAKEQGIAKAVFDRAGYSYHGLVKAVAEGAREGGLEF